MIGATSLDSQMAKIKFMTLYYGNVVVCTDSPLRVQLAIPSAGLAMGSPLTTGNQ